MSNLQIGFVKCKIASLWKASRSFDPNIQYTCLGISHLELSEDFFRVYRHRIQLKGASKHKPMSIYTVVNPILFEGTYSQESVVGLQP